MKATSRKKAHTLTLTLLNAVLLLAGSLAAAPLPLFQEVVGTGDLNQDTRLNFGVSWGDYDGDGDIDMFKGNALQQGNETFRNDGNGLFTRMTALEIGALANDAGDTSLGLWLDFDNDGDTDIYIANYSWALTESDWDNPNTRAQQDRLYLNDGHGVFTLASSLSFDGGPLRSYLHFARLESDTGAVCPRST